MQSPLWSPAGLGRVTSHECAVFLTFASKFIPNRCPKVGEIIITFITLVTFVVLVALVALVAIVPLVAERTIWQ